MGSTIVAHPTQGKCKLFSREPSPTRKAEALIERFFETDLQAELPSNPPESERCTIAENAKEFSQMSNLLVHLMRSDEELAQTMITIQGVTYEVRRDCLDTAKTRHIKFILTPNNSADGKPIECTVNIDDFVGRVESFQNTYSLWTPDYDEAPVAAIKNQVSTFADTRPHSFLSPKYVLSRIGKVTLHNFALFQHNSYQSVCSST